MASKKACTGPKTSADQIWLWSINQSKLFVTRAMSIVVGCRLRNDWQTDKQNGTTIRLTLCHANVTQQTDSQTGNETWCISKKPSRSASEWMTRLRSCADINAAIHEKNSRTSSVESCSFGGTRCCHNSFLSMNSPAHAGIHLHISLALPHSPRTVKLRDNFKTFTSGVRIAKVGGVELVIGII